MKAIVSAGRGLNFRSIEAEIAARTEMTPATAKAFAQVAFGNTVGPYTVSGDGKVYTVRNGNARRI